MSVTTTMRSANHAARNDGRRAPEDTVALIRDLVEIISSNKAKMVFTDAEEFIATLKKLDKVVRIYESDSNEHINEKIDFRNQLSNFLDLIKDTLNVATKDHAINQVIAHYVAAIRADYKTIRNKVQTLQDINDKIDQKAKTLECNKAKISGLLIRGVTEKMPNLIVRVAGTAANVTDETKLPVVRKFYEHFINYAACVRETMREDNFSDSKFKEKFGSLQSTLLKKEPNDIEFYFAKLVENPTQGRSFSKEVLLSNFVLNQMVCARVSNCSKFFQPKLFEVFNALSKCSSQENKADKSNALIEAVSALVFSLDNANFKIICDKVISQKYINLLAFKILYDVGLRCYDQASRFETDAVGEETKKLNVDRLESKFSILFLMLKQRPHLLKRMREDVINEKNCRQTYRLMSSLYEIRIRCLELDNKPIRIALHIAYAFEKYFFASLSCMDCEDVSKLDTFAKLLFYIHIYDDQPVSDDSEDNDDEMLPCRLATKLSRQLSDLMKKSEYNEQKVLELVEILQTMIKIGSLQFRFDCALKIFEMIEDSMNTEAAELNIKTEVMKLFFESYPSNESEICFRLAGSFNIDLLRNIFSIDKIAAKLSEYNSSFDCYLKALKSIDKTLSENEFTPGFSVPYYFTAKLLKSSSDVNANAELNSRVMPILFKVFTCSDSDKTEFLRNSDNLNKEFAKLKKSVELMLAFYKTDDANLQPLLTTLCDLSFKYILDGFAYVANETLSERNDNARVIIDNFINYKVEHVAHIKQSLDGKEEEIVGLFDETLKRRSVRLRDWAEETAKIGDKIYLMYCNHKYLQKDFDNWFIQLNQSTDSFQRLDSKRKQVQEEFKKNAVAFQKASIKYLQHNQVGALALIYDYLEQSDCRSNLFIKIGTGQGKSLTIAETARKIICENPKQQVFIITCYDHLAERDHANYEGFYGHFNITSVHISSKKSTLAVKGAQVIYADLETYFRVLRADAYNQLYRKGVIHVPDLSSCVLIMDEFDSLILDSDEIYQELWSFGAEHPVNVDNENEVKTKVFNSKFVDKLHNLAPEAFSRWYKSQIEMRKNSLGKTEPKTVQNSLGKTDTFAKSFLTVLNEKQSAQLNHFNLDPIIFYTKFKQVIGFSGSITRSGMLNFASLFEGKENVYYEMPPFFGIERLEKNRKFTNNPGYHSKSKENFVQQVLIDIKQHCISQPVLIFADNVKKDGDEKSEYQMIKDELEAKKDELFKNSTFYFVQKELDINRYIVRIGKLGAITLATRIIGRGADIRVDKTIKGGLHLVITYYPPRENIYVQMLGRTARQDEEGSYSEIYRHDKKFERVDTVKASVKNRTLHDMCEFYYQKVKDENLAVGDIRFPSLVHLLWYYQSDSFETSKLSLDALKAFITANLLTRLNN